MVSHEDPAFDKAKKCGYTLIPARVAALRLMPHAESHVTVSPDVRRVLPNVQKGPDEGGMITLNDMFMVMFNGQFTAPKVFPLQLIRSNCLTFEPYFKLIGN